jgi:flavodoxin
MKTFVIFDSNFGNARIIAETVAKELDAQMVLVSDFTPNLIREAELLVVGCPINWWRPTKRTLKFLSKLKKNQLVGMKGASFDTRMGSIFPWNDAMKKISHVLQKAGAEIVVPPHFFTVKGKKGPLVEGEIEKAVTWARSIKEKL